MKNISRETIQVYSVGRRNPWNCFRNLRLEATVKTVISLLILIFVSLTPAFCQQIDAATKEDIEQLLEITGARNDMQIAFAAAAEQSTSMVVEMYKRKNPNATPQQIRAVTETIAVSMQRMTKAFPFDELETAMVPVYQRHYTHSDIQALLDFYKSPVGQKFVKETPLILVDSMQAMRPLMEKFMAQLEAQAEAAGQAAKQPDGEPSK
jgi:hypothetical protein